MRNGPRLPVSASDVIVKAVTFFLIFIAVLAMFGKLRFPGQSKLASRKCPKCGRYMFGKKPCPCSRRSG